MSEHWNQYIVQVWHDFNCIDRLNPPPLPNFYLLLEGEGKILCNAISKSFYFKLVKHDAFISNYLPSFLWPDQYWWIYITQVERERASSGRLCLCLQRLSRPPHCRAIIISPLSISDPMGQVAYGFPKYLILVEWLYLNGTQPEYIQCIPVTSHVYASSKRQHSVFRLRTLWDW